MKRIITHLRRICVSALLFMIAFAASAGDGTQSAPYSCAELIAQYGGEMNNGTKDNVVPDGTYVTGYIVGGRYDDFDYNGNDYAMSIADSPAETDVANCVQVKLNKDLRPTWHPMNNPNILGAQILVSGSGDGYGEYLAIEKNVTIESLSATPIIITSTKVVSLTAETNASPVTEVINITGNNLTEGISLSLSSTSNFAVTPLSLPDTGGEITVTYTPSATVGVHTATLSLSSTGATDATITLNGETTLPELSTPVTSDATHITQTGFTANWNSVETATGYELNIYTKETGSVASDLFFSEYIEGSSSNKYLEIYNGTGADVDLSDYVVLNFANGKTEPANKDTLSGILPAGEVFVIANSNATIYTGTINLQSTVTFFNGDDAVALKKLSTDAYVDIFGRIGEDPGKEWTDNDFSTQDKTLVRKSSILSGISTNPEAGFPTLAAEWEMYDMDDVSNLGSHTITGGTTISHVEGSPFVIDGGNIISYSVDGLDNSKTYFYSVYALRDDQKSDVSNEKETVLNATGLLTNLSSSAQVWTVDGKVLFYAKAGESVQVFNANGQNIQGTIATEGVNSLTLNKKGLIIVKVANRISKVIL